MARGSPFVYYHHKLYSGDWVGPEVPRQTGTRGKGEAESV